MSRKRTIDYFFKPVHDPQVHSVADNIGEVEDEPIYVEPEEIGMSDLREVKLDSLIRDPGERPLILSYPINQRDEIRRLYIKLGPYQLEKSKYPSRLCGPNGYMRSFQQVSTTKILLQKLRDEGWEPLLDQVVCFCEKHSILVPDMNQAYRYVIRSCRNKDNVTTDHHYRVELFIAAIDSQLQELNSRFNKSATELLRLGVALDPKKPFNVDDICKLATTYYPADFTEHEKKDLLELELQHYELDVRNHPHLKNCSTLPELCIGLHAVGKSSTYPLLDRLIRLILTLPVSTATSERAFSTMKIVKTRFRNTMSDDFIRSCLLVNIEREIADTFSTDKIIDDFYLKKQRRAQLKVRKVLLIILLHLLL